MTARKKPSEPVFDGSTYSPKRDSRRLWTALRAVQDLMGDGEWRTLRNIQWELVHKSGVALPKYALKVSEAGISARLRDLRKEKFGSHTIERRRINGGGLWEYRMKLPDQMEMRL